MKTGLMLACFAQYLFLKMTDFEAIGFSTCLKTNSSFEKLYIASCAMFIHVYVFIAPDFVPNAI